jgi:Flp pilus assembly protein TadD
MKMDTAALIAAGSRRDAEPLIALGRRLAAEGRADDALTVFDHLGFEMPDHPALLSAKAAALSAQGRVLEGLQVLLRLRTLAPDLALAEINTHSGSVLERFNHHLAAGEVAEAEPYISALAALAPGHPAVVAAALSCNLTLGRADAARGYAQTLLALEPGNVQARQAAAELCRHFADREGEIEHRLFLALSPTHDLHPLLRLRDIHDLSSLILLKPLTELSVLQLEALRTAGMAISVPAEPGSEEEGWERHYRLLLAGIDIPAMQAATPAPVEDADLQYAASSGQSLSPAELRERADRVQAQVVFFAAADEAYVEFYARWYVLSILKYVDVPCLIVIHVIGGAGRLGEVAAKVGVDDDRLVFVADDFDASQALRTRCYESPPKGLMAKPVAHYQSVRFQRLGGLLDLLGRPVFVSDIDLILQRGVSDLLARTRGADVVLNENDLSHAAGSRITANLLLVWPTAPARAMLAFLRSYLDRALSGEAVTRWIDQLALILARHHLAFRAPEAKIAYFDTSSDINNVMYPSYQEHPFRFLSLFHGFDTSSLEGQASVLGGDVEPNTPGRKSKSKA